MTTSSCVRGDDGDFGDGEDDQHDHRDHEGQLHGSASRAAPSGAGRHTYDVTLAITASKRLDSVPVDVAQRMRASAIAAAATMTSAYSAVA